MVIKGALCNTGIYWNYAAKTEMDVRQFFTAAQPRSCERLGSKGLAVAANGASGGKEHADRYITVLCRLSRNAADT